MSLTFLLIFIAFISLSLVLSYKLDKTPGLIMSTIMFLSLVSFAGIFSYVSDIPIKNELTVCWILLFITLVVSTNTDLSKCKNVLRSQN